MARLLSCGFEANDSGVDGIGGTTGTSLVRSGSRALTGAAANNFLFTGVHGTTYYLRGYFRWTAWPSGANLVLKIGQGANGSQINLGTLGLVTCVTSAGSLPGSFQAQWNQWYRLEIAVRTSASASSTYTEWWVDGISQGSASNLNMTIAPSFVVATFPTGATGAIDDVALNDSTGSDENGLPGDGKVVLLLPVSDNARDTLWTGGAGGTTSLFDAVNNTPPVGLVSASATNTSQIEHAGGAAGTTDRYDANMTDYSTAGVTAGSTINAAYFIEADGEDIATGAKLLNFEVLSNPVIASPGNVTAGNGSAVGTYPTNWVVRYSSPVYDPAVTLGTSPVMRARRPETASRVASVCFMGIMVDYTPAVATLSPPFGQSGRRIQHMLVR